MKEGKSSEKGVKEFKCDDMTAVAETVGVIAPL